MNAIRRMSLVAVALALSLASPARAAASDPASRGGGSSLWLEGTSTMHDFESATETLTVSIQRDPAAAAPADANSLDALIRASGIRQVDVAVPVRTLRSKKSGLDKNLWKTMKVETYPNVRCQLTKYTVTSGAAGNDTLAIRAEGTLEIVGQRRPVTLDARAWRAPDGVWISGSKALLMSEYGIKPPTMMMGTLRVGDRIVVHYRLLLTPMAVDTGSSSAAGHEKGAER